MYCDVCVCVWGGGNAVEITLEMQVKKMQYGQRVL